ncbi:SETMR methyltransferase, partial [Acromyrmex insinuator]
FQDRNFNVKNAYRSGRSIVENVDEIFQKTEENRYMNNYDIAKKSNIDHKIVLGFYLRNTGYTKKLDVWVPHDLTSFLKRLITDDEKWTTYDNDVRKGSWSERDEALQTIAKPRLKCYMFGEIGK